MSCAQWSVEWCSAGGSISILSFCYSNRIKYQIKIEKVKVPGILFYISYTIYTIHLLQPLQQQQLRPLQQYVYITAVQWWRQYLLLVPNSYYIIFRYIIFIIYIILILAIYRIYILVSVNLTWFFSHFCIFSQFLKFPNFHFIQNSSKIHFHRFPV